MFGINDRKDVVYAPTYAGNSNNILETAEEDNTTFNPSHYLFFDNQNFETPILFVQYIANELKAKYNIPTTTKIDYQSDKLGDCFTLKSDQGSIEVHVPIRESPLIIKRTFLVFTIRRGILPVILNQSTTTFNQILFESSMIL